MKALGKLFKFMFGLVLTIVIVAVLLVLTLPFWIGPVAKTAANRTVPGITGTDFRLGGFGFNFYTGKMRIGDIMLANPEGYSPREALTLREFNIDLDVGSVFEDTIIIHEIALRDVFVSYVKKDGVYNFDVIADNAKKATACDGGEAIGEERRQPGELPDIELPQKGEEPSEDGDKGQQKRVVIDLIEISGITVQWGPIPLPLPAITIRDVGRESGGVSLDVAWREIYMKVLEEINSLGKGLVGLSEMGVGLATNSVNTVSGALVEGSGVVATAATNTVSVLTDAAKSGYGTVAEVSTNAVDTLTSSLKDGAGATVDMTKETLSATADATVDTLKSTSDAAKDAFRATSDTTKDAFRATEETLKAAGKELKSAGKEIKAAGKDLKNMFRNKQ